MVTACLAIVATANVRLTAWEDLQENRRGQMHLPRASNKAGTARVLAIELIFVMYITGSVVIFRYSSPSPASPTTPSSWL